MRTSAFTAAIVALTTLATSLTADDDFSALLADLTFADAPALSEPLSVAPEENVEDLKPVPSGIRMPGMMETASMSPETVPVTPPVEVTKRVVAEPTPQVALQDPIPVTDPVAADTIDMDAAIALHAPAPIEIKEVPAQVVGHRMGGCASQHGCQTGCCDDSVSCGPAVTCRPRTKPNLPSSSLLQYFRSDACYTNVWDNYHRSCRHHAHIHGTCDCFDKSRQRECGEVLPCAPADCVSCDSGCDR